MPSQEDLGQAVRHLRRARQLSIEALAFAAGMHPTYLGGIERGIANPTWRKVSDLADALDVSLSRIVQLTEEEAIVALAVRDARGRLAHEPLRRS
jgi:transcriptional regulator with XRE-family HTH domain